MNSKLYVLFGFFIYSQSIFAQQPIRNWNIASNSSVTISNDTIRSGSGNVATQIVAPVRVINPCQRTVSSPYLRVKSVQIPGGGKATPSRLTMGYRQDESGYSAEYSVEMQNISTGISVKTQFVTKINGTTQTTTDVSGDVLTGKNLEIQVYDANQIRLYTDGTLRTTLSMSSAREGQFYVDLRHEAAGQIILTAATGYYPCTSSKYFADVLPQLDGGTVQLFDDTLRLKYIQEYASESVSYRIYNWNKSVNTTASFSASYGVNWRKIAVGALASGYYVVELEGNKKQRYYLRFKK
jgi:hypothetical protein